MNVFNKYKYWINSGKYTSIQKFAIMFMGILSFMMLTRRLETVYGVWGLFIIISSVTETARNALVRNAFIRFMSQHDEKEQGHLQGAAILLSTFVSVILGVLFLLLSKTAARLLKAPELEGMLNWYVVSLMVTVVFSQCEILLNAKMDFRGICWINCIRQGVLLSAVAFCFFLKIEITTSLLSVFYLVSVVAGSLGGIKFALPYLRWQFDGYREWVPQLWKFGKHVFANNIFSQLFRSTDNFITSYYFGPGIAGHYNASLRISNLVDMPSAVLADIMFPKVAKYNSIDKSSIKYMYEKSVGATLIFSIPALIIILLFPTLILHILAGKKFIVAAPILRITAFFGFVLPFLKQFGTIMDATGSPNINNRVMFFAFCINILFNISLVHVWGVYGAAAGTASTYFVLFVITQVILHRKFGVNLLNVLKYTGLLYVEIFNTLRMTLKPGKQI